MSNCTEFVLDDLMAVTCIPVGKISTDSAESPALKLTKTFKASDYDFALNCIDDDTTVVGREKAWKAEIVEDTRVETAVGKLIPIKRFTGKARDDEADSVAGRLHTVKVTCEVDDRDGTVWEDLLTLERTPCHLLLTFRDGTTQGFVSATPDTYLCEVERDGAKTSVSIRVQNLMGIQLIT